MVFDGNPAHFISTWKIEIELFRNSLFYLKTTSCPKYFVHSCRYLVLFGPEKYDDSYNRIRYLISLKSGITYIFSHYYAIIKVDSYDSLPIEKILTLHNVTILTKSVRKKDKDQYYYDIFLEKYSYQLAKTQSQNLFDSITMLRFGKKIVRERFYAPKEPINVSDVNTNKMVISKLIETKTTSKYLIEYLDKFARRLVLIVPKMSGYVKTFKVKDGEKDNNKLFGLRLKS